jgi:nucleotide-binding universal stress UspA family protein
MKKILLAYDGGDPAKRALETAADLARVFEASVSVISVVPFRPGSAFVGSWDERDVHAQELLEAKKMLLARGLEAELLEPLGDPARTIERIADEGAYDTIVVGSRHLGALDRVLQGSVSEHVATHADATVVIAR